MTFLNVTLLCFGVSIVVGWVAGASRRGSAALNGAAWTLAVAGSLCAVAAGSAGLAGHRMTMMLHLFAGSGLHVDRLSGFFLVVVFGTAVPTLLAAAALRQGTSGPESARRMAPGLAYALISLFVILTANDLFVLLIGWESLGFTFYLLTGFERARAGRARASVVTVTFSKASGAAILAGGLLASKPAAGFALSALHVSGPSGQLAYALLILGFGIKAGLVPMHVWLPDSYAAAPGAARAIMAGVAVNAGFYGLWRTMDVLGAPPVWLAGVVLVLAGITAVLGISHAAVHADIRHLIAWSSIENAGLIIAGYGTAMVGLIIHSSELAAAGLLAASAQVITHAIGKSLLFTASAAIEQQTGSTDLDLLRGIAHRLKVSGTGLTIGAMTLAGLPLTAGFASEWLTLQALMQHFRVGDLALQLSTAAAGVLVALTIGVGGLTFVRLVGLTAFGHPTTEVTGTGIERSALYRAAIVLLSAACAAAAIFAVPETQLIASGVSSITGKFSAKGAPFALQPVFKNFSSLSPGLLWIVIPAIAAILAIVTIIRSRAGVLHVRHVPVWQSASPGVEGRLGYTSFAFANPMRKVLGHLLLTRSELRRLEPDDAEPTTASVQLGYRVDVVEIADKYLYRPAFKALAVLVRAAKRIQSGRLDAYIAYMLVAVVAAVATVTVIVSQ